MPEGAVYVGRPSLLGNPFNAKAFGAERAVALYREALYGGWNPALVEDLSDRDAELVYATAKDWRRRISPSDIAGDVRFWLREIRKAKYLACWCPLDQPCHADVLVELAA